jgi:hypothetical protein
MCCASFDDIFLLHGKGGRPSGSVLQLEELLRPQFASSRFTRPSLLHGDPAITAGASLAGLLRLDIPEGAAVIGISLDGLLAASLQETVRPDLHVTCISSPTWADDVQLTLRMTNRLALYSSSDAVINGRTGQRPQLAQAFDLPWLTHDTDAHKGPLAEIGGAFLRGDDVFHRIVAEEEMLRRKGTIA